MEVLSVLTVCLAGIHCPCMMFLCPWCVGQGSSGSMSARWNHVMSQFKLMMLGTFEQGSSSLGQLPTALLKRSSSPVAQKGRPRPETRLPLGPDCTGMAQSRPLHGDNAPVIGIPPPFGCLTIAPGLLGWKCGTASPTHVHVSLRTGSLPVSRHCSLFTLLLPLPDGLTLALQPRRSPSTSSHW